MDIDGHANINENSGEKNGQGDNVDVGVDDHRTANSNVGEVKLGAGVDADGNDDTRHHADGPLVSIGDVDITDGQGGERSGGGIGMDIDGHANINENSGEKNGQGDNVVVGVDGHRTANSNVGAGLDKAECFVLQKQTVHRDCLNLFAMSLVRKRKRYSVSSGTQSQT